MAERAKGFTLIELMIVVAIIAVIASIAIPRLLSARLAANEAAAVATLRDIASAQSQFQARAVVDVNGNGNGEFGFLGELSADAELRNDESGGLGTERMSPAVMSAAFGNITAGRVLRSGYYYQMFLPDSNRAPQGETGAGGGAGVSISASNSEVFWCCYAWPSGRGTSGRRAFFVNHVGQIISCNNLTAKYHGVLNPPPGTAAALASVSSPQMGSTIATNATGQDGEFWLALK